MACAFLAFEFRMRKKKKYCSNLIFS